MTTVVVDTRHRHTRARDEIVESRLFFLRITLGMRLPTPATSATLTATSYGQGITPGVVGTMGGATALPGAITDIDGTESG
jgi:hypothetical protein